MARIIEKQPEVLHKLANKDLNSHMGLDIENLVAVNFLVCCLDKQLLRLVFKQGVEMIKRFCSFKMYD